MQATSPAVIGLFPWFAKLSLIRYELEKLLRLIANVHRNLPVLVCSHLRKSKRVHGTRKRLATGHKKPPVGEPQGAPNFRYPDNLLKT